jgi:DNA polymerase-3 subunit alpha
VLGLPLRLRIARQTADASAQAELDLGEDGRFWPSDEALARCKALAHGGRAEIVYEVS